MQANTLPGPQAILDLITDFYCSLTKKKDIQQMITQIRQFVFSRSFSHSKEIVSKMLIDYFLKLQMRLKTRSEEEWDVMFELSTARDRACISLSQFEHKYLFRRGLGKLKERQYLHNSQLIQSKVHETQITLMDDIQIDEDIKTKTKYFFKWCLFLKHSKLFKEQKQKEIENLKISKVFNNFGIQFNYFTAWKLLYKKRKALKQKQLTIKLNSQTKLLHKCMNRVKEVVQILAIQDQLKIKIQNQLIVCRKIQTFNRLKNNKIKNILIARKFKVCDNLYYYKFIRQITDGKKSNLCKSFLLKRQQMEKKQKILLQKNCFNKILSHLSTKTDKIRKVRNMRKQVHLKMIRNQLKQKQLYTTNKSTVQHYLKTKRIKIAITILNFYQLAQEQQTRKVESLIACGQITNMSRSLMEVNLKKQREEKQIKCVEAINLLQKNKVLGKLLSNKMFNDNQIQKFSQIDAIFKKRWFKKIRMSKITYQRLIQIKRTMQIFRNKKMKQKSMQRIKYLKKYNKIQENALNSINNFHIFSAKLYIWNKIRRQVQQKQLIQSLTCKIMKIINRNIFCKIAGRTYSINKQVEKLRRINNRKSMRMLFNMFIQNRNYGENMGRNIVHFQMQIYKTRFFKHLNFNNQEKNIQNSARKKLQKIKKQIFLSNLSDISEQAFSTHRLYVNLAKKVFIRYFKSCFSENLAIKQKIRSKTNLLQTEKKRNLSMTFLENMKVKVRQQQNQSNKMYEVAKISGRRGTNSLHHSINLLKRKQNLLHKQKQIQIFLKNRELKNLLFEEKYKKMQSNFNAFKLCSSFKDFTQIVSKGISCNHKMKKLNQFFVKCEQQTFFAYLKHNRDKEIKKYHKLTNYLQLKRNNEKKVFLRLITANKQNCSNQLKLCRRIKHKSMSGLITTIIRMKFNRLKYNCSLKHYARNLLKKGFKYLKRAHFKIKHKENMAHFDKSSSILMQRSLQKSNKNNSLLDKIQKFNQRKNKQSLSRAY